MNQSNPHLPWMLILFLLLIGAGALAIAFWLVDHRQAVPNFGVTLAVLAAVFLGSYTWAFLRYLNWRDQRRGTVVGPVQSNPYLKGTIYGMIPEREYQVMQSFVDYYGNRFEQGERLRFKQRHFLPYHGGHTVVFDGKALYLQEDESREILDQFSEYIRLIES